MGKQIYIFQHFAGSIIHQLGYIYTEQSLVSGLGSHQGLGPQSLGAQSQSGINNLQIKTSREGT